MLFSTTKRKLQQKISHYKNVRHIRANIDQYEATSVADIDGITFAPAIVHQESGDIRQGGEEFDNCTSAQCEANKLLMTRDIKKLAKYR